jgi:hypothetical protein
MILNSDPLNTHTLNLCTCRRADPALQLYPGPLMFEIATTERWKQQHAHVIPADSDRASAVALLAVLKNS